MAAHACAFGPECAVGQKARRAIAEMQLTSGEARRMIEQSGHGVLVAIAVFETPAQNHIAAAFAMDRTGFGKAPQALGKATCRRERLHMEFGVTAGQPTAVGVLWRRFIGKRRER